MIKEKMTIEKLGEMAKNSFDEMNGKVGEIKEELKGVNLRLDRMENLLITDYGNRIEKLEDSVKEIKTSLSK